MGELLGVRHDDARGGERTGVDAGIADARERRLRLRAAGACGNSGKPSCRAVLRRTSCAHARAMPRTRPMKRWRSVTLIAPRASSELNACELFMQNS